MMSVQSIVLRRLNKILLPTGTRNSTPRTPVSRAVVATFNLNLQSLGYTLSAKAINAFLRLSEASANLVFDEVVSALKEIKGVRNYKPMYPNFPKQVIEASDAELYINAIMHYFSFMLVDMTGDPDNIWLPKYVKEKREPLTEKVELRVLGLATLNDVNTLTHRIATSNTSLSASDKVDLRTLITNGYGDVHEIFPAISNKENLSYLGAMFLGTSIDITPYFKTATDVLRLAVAMSDGDVSLKDNTKFRSFKRSERKFLLGLLESIPNKLEDMTRWSERWKRLAYSLHVGEYANRFPTTFAAASSIRENESVPTFRTHVEAALRGGNALQAMTLLMERPGEFARRLDHVLRQAHRHSMSRIVTAFASVANQVSTPVLLQVLAHFEHRGEGEMRVAFPKGNVAQVTSIDTVLPSLPAAVVGQVVWSIRDILVERFSAFPKMGKVYIDPALKDYLVPFSQRSASKTLRTLVRGSKMAFGDDKNTIRFFIWWHDMVGKKSEKKYGWESYDSNRVDLDLSAVGYDEEWNHRGQVAFYNLREGFAVHSGDITSAPKGASEFIDVNISKAINSGMRYIVMTVHGFTEQNFVDLPECFAGFMLRDKAQSGEVYDPRTIVDRADLTAGCRDSVPLIIDLIDRKVIWCDAAMTTHSRYSWGHTASSTRGSIELLGKAFTNIKKPNLYDLLSLHAEARGKLVKSEDKADVVFSVKSGTPFELDRIASEFMADADKVPTKKKKAAIA